MQRHVNLFTLVLVFIIPQFLTTTTSVSAAAPTKPLSHRLCEGGGFNLVCGDGQQVHIHKAWFGRLAHDTETCVDDVTGNTSLDLQPDLARDCGVDVLSEKGKWCEDVDNGAGCSIAVQDLGVGLSGATPCPITVTKKYLYLEYSCAGAGAGSAASFVTSPGNLALLSVVSVLLTLY